MKKTKTETKKVTEEVKKDSRASETREATTRVRDKGSYKATC